MLEQQRHTFIHGYDFIPLRLIILIMLIMKLFLNFLILFLFLTLGNLRLILSQLALLLLDRPLQLHLSTTGVHRCNRAIGCR